MIGALVGLLVLGFVGMIALVATIAVLGLVFSMVFGAVSFLLFKILPIVVVGWVVLKLVGHRCPPRARGISAADQRWLDGELE